MITTRKSAIWLNQNTDDNQNTCTDDEQQFDQNTKEIYYGKIQKISSENDISYLSRGSVFFLRDNIKDPETTYHPYLVIQSTYLDKISRITVLGITSVPSSINMVPIVMKDSIGYIDPHQPYTYKIDEFYESGTRFVGSIINTKALDIAVSIYGLHLGISMCKTEDEIIADYLDYVKEFKERSKHLKPYKHKVLADNHLGDLELKISYMSGELKQVQSEDFDDVISDISSSNIEDDKFDDRDDTEELLGSVCFGVSSESENDDNIPHIYGKKRTLVIDRNSQAILSALAVLETRKRGEVKLPKFISRMTDDEIILFMASLEINGKAITSQIYNCCNNTLYNKKKQIYDKFNIIYK